MNSEFKHVKVNFYSVICEGSKEKERNGYWAEDYLISTHDSLCYEVTVTPRSTKSLTVMPPAQASSKPPLTGHETVNNHEITRLPRGWTIMCLNVIFTDSSATNSIYRTSSNVQHIIRTLTLPDRKPIHQPPFCVKHEDRVLLTFTKRNSSSPIAYMPIKLNTGSKKHGYFLVSFKSNVHILSF